MSKNVYEELENIFRAGVARVDPALIFKKHVFLEQNKLLIKTETVSEKYDLDKYNSIIVLGAGKATAKMALALEKLMGSRITKGLISVKRGHTEKLERIKIIEAGHPVPNTESVRAAREIASLSREGDEKTLFINLISGGGSALLSYPYEDSSLKLSLEDKQKTTELLLASGASIQEINCIRKHISGIKGGRLAEMMFPADSLNLILSDVVGDRLDSIASGLTVTDESAFVDAVAIVEKYGLKAELPGKVMELLTRGSAGNIPETPKKGDSAFKKVRNILIGTNLTALLAAGEKALSLGYNVKLLSSRIIGDVKDAALMFLGIGQDIEIHNLLAEKPACIIGGGETTVILKGKGLGGRNQEMALHFLEGIYESGTGSESIYFLSAGTDGNDGPTDAAGAFASLEILREAENSGLDLDEYLENNDSYHFFEKIKRLLKTGATNTNVCDLQIMIVK
ncbi:MAG: glycerate kinase [Spirochaetes bacterium]|nr:MAG: glycerate kinase [Spirochaetota bacterium]